MLEKGTSMMELYIETLTGTAFELRVHPAETIQDVKARIQKMEGIPIAQQHLIWESTELEDDCCLSDYNIQDRSTLKLVLTLRGGPINTRRIPMDDSSFVDVGGDAAEGEDANETSDSTGHPFTVIVYHDGGHMKFFRVVDRDILSPGLTAACGGDEDDNNEEMSRTMENNAMKQKMKTLRLKMEKVHLDRKLKKVTMPRPPSHSRSGGSKKYGRHVVFKKPATFTTTVSQDPAVELKHTKAPAAVPSTSHDYSTEQTSSCTSGVNDSESTQQVMTKASSAASPLANVDSTPPVALLRSTPQQTSSDVQQGFKQEADQSSQQPEATLLPVTDVISRTEQCKSSSVHRLEFSANVLLKREETSAHKLPQETSKKPAAKKLLTLNTLPSSLLPQPPRPVATTVACSTTRPLERLTETDTEAMGPGRPQVPDVTISSFQRRSPLITAGRRSGVIVESLDPSEVHGVINSIVRSAGKSKFSLMGSARRNIRTEPVDWGDAITTETLSPAIEPSERNFLIPVVSSTSDASAHELPPVKMKRKVATRCSLCGKRTGLATTYQCRCGGSFCAVHRYAEMHNCSFDYKSEGRKLLERSNPVVTAPKLPKI